MSRIRFFPGALFCYVLAYLALVALAVRKGMGLDGFSLVVWLFSAFVIFACCAIAPLLLRTVVKLRMGTFIMLWAGTIAIFGTALVVYAK